MGHPVVLVHAAMAMTLRPQCTRYYVALSFRSQNCKDIFFSRTYTRNSDRKCNVVVCSAACLCYQKSRCFSPNSSLHNIKLDRLICISQCIAESRACLNAENQYASNIALTSSMLLHYSKNIKIKGHRKQGQTQSGV